MQKLRKEQDTPDEARDDGHAATAVRNDGGTMAPSADLNGSSHANGAAASHFLTIIAVHALCCELYEDRYHRGPLQDTALVL